ncbi:hypothetical protein BRD05_03635 [Halobacteriales archaeon QS_9_70_65]|nr:MAG: hypothetical protein BRD05_03635 [Halobacteriales archaeon QS_9_70_65]
MAGDAVELLVRLRVTAVERQVAAVEVTGVRGEAEHEEVPHLDGHHQFLRAGPSEHHVLDDLVFGDAALGGGVGDLIGHQRRQHVAGADREAPQRPLALGGDPDRVAVGGDSAGGNLAAAVALAARDRDGPEMGGVEWYLEQYLRGSAELGNAYAFPLRARSLADLPPATILTAGFDPLTDEGAAYADRLGADGTAVEHRHYDARIHGFCSLYERIDEERAALGYVADRVAGVGADSRG